MPAERFFYDGDFKSIVILADEELRHLQKVMRARVGDTIELVNGRSELAQAVVKKYDGNAAILQVTQMESRPPSKIRILAQAMPRPSHLDFIIEKGTEVGATAFWLFPGEFSEKEDLSPNQSRRLRILSIAALKQCGRLDLPLITIHPPLSAWTSLPCPTFFGDTKPEAAGLTPDDKANEASMICIGPEKGFSEKEIACLERLGAKGIKLHDNILRVETAAIVGLVLS